jgi:hypothetical protein
MVDTISRTIVLHDSLGREIKELKPGMVAQVRVQNIPIYRILNTEFSIINKK